MVLGRMFTSAFGFGFDILFLPRYSSGLFTFSGIRVMFSFYDWHKSNSSREKRGSQGKGKT
jgi:hypothetical protein